ncbi:MAG: F0F1 ATP synthase subunit B [Bacteroidales bacterium]|jgi:F-type H+-transporting ATPase subunit b|nr:F0F1 ATP synthase subunit B [Bacteroidales bacterium]MDI9592124.1 F0F1 ATP synthase subunit B [Bacteroidota bacterium]NLH33083.1 F0F1 ATP synthase subunit B [Lentimicrobium sp.]OQC38120.1 MAG: ATP synthase subunit b precursor [Bacteroidetes bacterium ADurb.Bin041]MBP7874050.1 F0F1 ATP synthase subunit B [Bacteroidales bacterium]
MELVSPGLGLIFWMTLAFGVVLWILAKFAWKPIMKSIHEREKSIDNALEQAEEARQEMRNLQANSEEMIRQTKIEQDEVVKATARIKEKMIQDAKEKASAEAEVIIEKTRKQLELEKQAAMIDLKNQIGQLSIEIAEKLLNRELKDKSAQKDYLDELIKDIKLN